MKKKRFKKEERGFALVVAILLLVVMTIMGSTLVALVSNDFRENDRRDYYQQALYAAESGITQAKNDLQSLATARGTHTKIDSRNRSTHSKNCPPEYQ